MSTTDLLGTALALRAAGVSIVPIDHRTKKAKGAWKHLQSSIASEAEVRNWIERGGAKAIAAVGGAVSGGLLVLDFDEAEFFDRWRDAVGGVPEGAFLQRTGGGGYQLWFRCEQPGGNTKLAFVPNESEETGRSVAIETRGEGGYALIAPSIHPSGNHYERLSGDIANLPTIPQEDVEKFLAAAKALDQAPHTRQELEAQARQSHRETHVNQNGQANVIDAFNERHTIQGVLEANGYKKHGNGRWIRPGGKNGTVSIKDGRSCHWASNDPLNDGKHVSGCGIHDAFAAWAHFNHRSNVKAAVLAAAKELGMAYKPSTDGGKVFKVDDADLKLFTSPRPVRGKYAVRLMRGDDVLVTGQVNPHEQKQIDAFIAAAAGKIPNLNGQADWLRTQLLQLAVPTPAPASTPCTHEDHPYSERAAGIFYIKPTPAGPVPVQLTNFKAKIVADNVRDDGAERESMFEIEAMHNGRQHRIAVSASRFASMNWAIELGAEAILFPGQAVRDHARVAVQLLSPRPIPRRVIYSHTGWRKLDDEDCGNCGNCGWVYLHAGGGISSDGAVAGMQVELAGPLALYQLPAPPTGDDLKSAIRASLGMLDLCEPAIIFPIFCAIWRAVLGGADFSLHLCGATGVFKSELAALAQQHFGSGMDARHLPGSFHSTDNATEMLLFSTKDAMTVVDDFAPNGTPADQARWHQRYDRIGRGVGNNSGRGRMRADGTLRPVKPPRSMMIATGETLPNGQSLRARLFIVEISRGDISATVLTRCQRDARSGKYAAALSGFIQHLAGSYDAMRDSLRSKAEAMMQAAIRCNAHARTPSIVGNLAAGLHHFIDFAQATGALTQSEAEALWERGWSALLSAANEQCQHQSASEPAGRFIELLVSAIASGHAHLADRDGNAPPNAGAWGWRMKSVGTGAYARDDWQPQGDRIGWIDGDDVLLDPDASYRTAQTMAGTSGDGLAVNARILRKRLDEKGLIVRQGDRSELLSNRTLEGRLRRVININLAGHPLSGKSTESTESTESPPGDAKNAVGDEANCGFCGNCGNPQGEGSGKSDDYEQIERDAIQAENGVSR